MEKKRIYFEIEDESPFEFGQKLFVISTNNSKTFNEICPVCGGTKTVSIKGFELECPMCSKPMNGNSLTLRNYTIDEYIINQITIKGEAKKTAYKKTIEDVKCQIEYVAFTKANRGLSDYRTRIVHTSDINNFYTDIWEKTFSSYLVPFTVTEAKTIVLHGDTFLKKNDAELILHQIQNKQRELLDEFNKKHGTDYQYPFGGD